MAQGELLERIIRGNFDCCIDFHTHPPKGYFDVFSDMDYMAFEWIAQYLKRMNNVNMFAILSTPNRNTRILDRESKEPIKNIQFSAIYCQPQTSDNFEYYRFPNICYIKKA